MIPISLKANNFLCFRDVSVNLEGIHVACLCGENGAGKSSVFDAITWALWGETSRGRGDDLICSGQNEAMVELEFRSGANQYRVVRKQGRGTATRSGKSALDIQVFDGSEYKPMAEYAKRETQAAINSLLHLDYDTFINSAMILQGRSNEFSKKRPGERKEILANVLDLRSYDNVEQRAKDLADSNRTEAANLERDLQTLAGKVGDRSLFEQEKDTAEASLDDIVAGKEAAYKRAADLRGWRGAMSAKKEQADLLSEQITSRQNKLTTQKKKLEGTTANIERLKKVIADWPETEAAYLKCHDDLKNNKKSLSDVVTDIQVLTAANTDIAAAINDLNDKRAMLGELGAACPLCETELGADGCAKLRDKLTNELTQKGDQQAENHGKIVRSNYDKAHLTKAIKAGEFTLKELEIPRSEAAAANIHLSTEEIIRDNLKDEIDNTDVEITRLVEKSNALAAEISGVGDIEVRYLTAETEASELAARERKIREVITRAGEKLRQIDEYSTEISQKEAALRIRKEDEGIYSELARCFGKRGIQALIIEETLPEIEAEANLLLDKMTDGRMSLTLETQRDTKKGSTIETLDIKIADELGTRPYENFSGGESFRIDLALRIAISRLLVRRAGASMPLLIIDEGFGTQDSAGIERLVEAINSIQDDFERIFVITHLDELKDRFPSLITVTKGVDGSKVTMDGG